MRQIPWNCSLIACAFLSGFMMVAASGCKKAPEETPQPSAPIVVTLEATGITSTSAISGGKVLSRGSTPLSERGVCWNGDGNPTIEDTRTSDGTGMGTYTSILNELEEGVSYTVRAYAINSMGTAYGEEVSFKTTGTLSVTFKFRNSTADIQPVVYFGESDAGSPHNSLIVEVGHKMDSTDRKLYFTIVNQRFCFNSGTNLEEDKRLYQRFSDFQPRPVLG